MYMPTVPIFGPEFQSTALCIHDLGKGLLEDSVEINFHEYGIYFRGNDDE